jgi:hypothetical protein
MRGVLEGYRDTDMTLREADFNLLVNRIREL